MKLLLLNYPYLKTEYQKLGHQVVAAGHYPDCDIQLNQFSFAEIAQKVNLSEFYAVIYADGLDDHFLYSGMENIPCLTVYIGIDSTINYFWQQHFARNFDLIFFDQPAEVRLMQQNRSGCFPLLLGFDQNIYHDYKLPKKFDISFVGRLHADNRPKRNNLLELLKKHNFKINLIDGINQSVTPHELAKIYNSSRIVINENLFPSLNLRLLESLACNTLVFTEDTCKDLQYFFNDGFDLVTYNAQNIVSKLNYYLNQPDLTAQIAQSGYEKSQKWHSDYRRAEFVIARLMETDKRHKNRDLDSYHLANAAIDAFLKWSKNPSSANNQLIMQIFYNDSQNSTIFAENITRLKIAILGQDFKTAQVIILSLDIFQIKSSKDLQVIFWAALQTGQKEIVEKILEKYLSKFRANYSAKSNDLDLYRMIWADHLVEDGQSINLGLTVQLPDIFCSAFDFYTKCNNNPDFSELALNKMAKILVSVKANDYAAQIYERLSGVFPQSNDYREKADFYNMLSYK